MTAPTHENFIQAYHKGNVRIQFDMEQALEILLQHQTDPNVHKTFLKLKKAKKNTKWLLAGGLIVLLTPFKALCLIVLLFLALMYLGERYARTYITQQMLSSENFYNEMVNEKVVNIIVNQSGSSIPELK
ncbi:hypothetical protein KCM76_17680 [Zooshikella marina]|uniref:hypothetical protein n=1 Tax=Zooshikella ganghwensis TaxID=202772 RepID=UPI00040AC818|nr:hypothetical protein [Zooshikella ganghwensis]MBU2707829.1 hypothetical protein [Zooshikella ganghwensis]